MNAKIKVLLAVIVLSFVMSGCVGRAPMEGTIVSKHFTPAHYQMIERVEYMEISRNRYLPFYKRENWLFPDTYSIEYSNGNTRGKVQISRDRFNELREGEYIKIKKARFGYDVLTKN